VDDEYDITIEELDVPTCWRLVARTGFGRVGFVHAGEVTVLPVNAAEWDRRIIFRTVQGTSLALAGNGSVVAFETDNTDRSAESGWSVIVRGQLWDVTHRAEAAQWHQLLVRSWAPPPRNVWMMIQPTAVTGRMIHRHRYL
jgi:nitroimidazol reductase NimA-like FMN-containing flavoprotein (pyridoxamine 5'-phosphate oxidase superfamily)